MKQALENAIMAYVREFEKKHNVEFECWIGLQFGVTACFGDELITDFNNIRLDIDENAPKEMFIDWYWCSGLKCNYKSYLQGCRI